MGVGFFFFLSLSLLSHFFFSDRFSLLFSLSLSFSQGVAINLVRSEDMAALRDIEAFYGTSIAEMPANVADRI